MHDLIRCVNVPTNSACSEAPVVTFTKMEVAGGGYFQKGQVCASKLKRYTPKRNGTIDLGPTNL